MKNLVFQQNGIEREDKLKKINEKIAASQAAKKPGKYIFSLLLKRLIKEEKYRSALHDEGAARTPL